MLVLIFIAFPLFIFWLLDVLTEASAGPLLSD